MIHAVWLWLLHVTGSDDVSGTWYGFWSGFAGDLGLFGGMIMLYHKHNCHQPWCLRVGKHSVDGTPYCSKHHPGL